MILELYPGSFASYRGPRPVMRRLLEAGRQEGRILGMLMTFCLLGYFAQWPRLGLQARQSGEDLQMLLAGALLGWIFVLPLVMYGIAALSHMIARLLGGQGSWYSARLALFWSAVASVHMLLLHGLISGYFPPGGLPAVTGTLWLAVFFWFWLSNLAEAEKGTQKGAQWS